MYCILYLYLSTVLPWLCSIKSPNQEDTGWHIYDFFSIPVVHIDNREQFLVTFSYIFAPFLSPFCVCETGPEEHKSAKYVSIMNWVGMGEVTVQPVLKICKKSTKHWRVCGWFLMSLPDIEQYLVNTCEIFKMINMIAWEHILGSIKFNNVHARYRLYSGQTSPTIFRPLKFVNQIFLKARWRGNISCYRVDSGKIHYGIEFSMSVATWSGQNTWKVV